ncbi:hypothetical protein [Halostreptopolyspora alba]|uniref:Uncharacterized protein n=1 Tax=Halostreptopolyspora alba TaxID=2487137 RepID=A0A3N0E1E6_9ACTN|nr:hypothetical protein EFW17_21735 [Nocardiopsaceae bacterium YIM 96095]
MITVAWTVEDDEYYYRTAVELQRFVGSQWLVFWGPGSRAFWAFLRGGDRSLMLSAPDLDQLYTSIQWHIPIDRRGGAVQPPLSRW